MWPPSNSCESASGFHTPSKANRVASLAAVDAIAVITSNLFASLETSAPPRSRTEEVARAYTRSAHRSFRAYADFRPSVSLQFAEHHVNAMC